MRHDFSLPVYFIITKYYPHIILTAVDDAGYRYKVFLDSIESNVIAADKIS